MVVFVRTAENLTLSAFKQPVLPRPACQDNVVRVNRTQRSRDVSWLDYLFQVAFPRHKFESQNWDVALRLSAAKR